MTFFKRLPKHKHADLFFTRLYYFSFIGGVGFLSPFLNMFYVSLGFSGKQIGSLASTSAIVGLFAAPLIVTEIEKRPQARSFLQVLLVLGALRYFIIGQQTTFLPIILIIILQALVTSSLSALSDAIVVSVLQENEAGYGSLRVFGSLGWIVVVPNSGWLIEKLGFQVCFAGVCMAWLTRPKTLQFQSQE